MSDYLYFFVGMLQHQREVAYISKQIVKQRLIDTHSFIGLFRSHP